MILRMENANRDRGYAVAAELPRVISDARHDARIDSLRDLARRAGMSHTYLNARMREGWKFTAADIVALGEVMGVGAVELLRRAVGRAMGDAPRITIAHSQDLSFLPPQRGGDDK